MNRYTRSVALGLIGLVLAACETPQHLGGDWYAVSPARLPEAGFRGHEIVRKTDGEDVVIARGVRSHDFYPPDCVLYRTDPAIWMACGTVEPVAVSSERAYGWELMGDSLVLEGEPELVDGVALATVKTISLADVRAWLLATDPAARRPFSPTVVRRPPRSRDAATSTSRR